MSLLAAVVSVRISINQRSLADGREPIVVEYEGTDGRPSLMRCGSVELEGPARLVWDRRASHRGKPSRVWLVTDSPVVAQTQGHIWRIFPDDTAPEPVEF